MSKLDGHVMQCPLCVLLTVRFGYEDCSSALMVLWSKPSWRFDNPGPMTASVGTGVKSKA